MKILPWLLRFKLRHGNFTMPTLWLPIIVLWPIVIPLLLLAFLMALLAVLILDTRSVKRFFLLSGGVYSMLCEFRGTSIDVRDRENQVFIALD